MLSLKAQRAAWLSPKMVMTGTTIDLERHGGKRSKLNNNASFTLIQNTCNRQTSSQCAEKLERARNQGACQKLRRNFSSRGPSRVRNTAAIASERLKAAMFIQLLSVRPFGMVQGSYAHPHGSHGGSFLLGHASLSSGVSADENPQAHKQQIVYVPGCSARTVRRRCVCGRMAAGSAGSPCCHVNTGPALAAERSNTS
jgi:hypothetical protein